jgi:hypothetical protein
MTMGYLFLIFWLSKPIFVAIWAYQVGLLTPVQVAHEIQPQIEYESQKTLNFWSVVHGG